jgi:hypothetical protein
MATIIRQDYPVQHFNKLVFDFLYADTRVNLSKESIARVEERLLEVGPLFGKMFTPFFDPKVERKIDRLMGKMMYFVEIRIPKAIAGLSDEEKSTFLMFWDIIAEIIEADYPPYEVQNLRNSCRWFNSVMRKMQLVN